MVKANEKSTGTGLSFERKWDGDIERLKRSVEEGRELRTSPMKTSLKADVLRDCSVELERYYCFMYEVFNQEAESEIHRYAIRYNRKFLRLSDSLLRLAIENRWMYQHDTIKLSELEKITGETDMLSPLFERAHYVLALQKSKRYANFEGEFGAEIEAFISQLCTTQWKELADDNIKRMRKIRLQMFYVDHEAREIIFWKEAYLKSSKKIEKLLCRCLDLMLPCSNDRVFNSFEDYIATLE